MREIEFRGKRVDNGEWVEGSYQADVMSLDKHTIIYSDSEGYYCEDEVIPETVGQYTGLKDKNGTEIYEGDIYHQGDKNITYTVVWNDTGLKGKQNKSSSYAGLEYWLDRMEVIGNIHDNPELLEVQDD